MRNSGYCVNSELLTQNLGLLKLKNKAVHLSLKQIHFGHNIVDFEQKQRAGFCIFILLAL
jgi:hypothetical protein